MIKTIFIIGSGKMAIDTGFYFLRNEYPVIWISRNDESSTKLKKNIEKKTRRVLRIEPGLENKMKSSFYIQSDCPMIEPDTLLIECVSEDLKLKRYVFDFVYNKLKEPQSIILSTVSSSILPSEIGKDIVGLHFFYPLEITSFAELIISNEYPDYKADELITLLNKLVLSYVTQDSRSAFISNRLLLPIQNEVFRLLKEGYLPQSVEKATISDLLPIGQLSLMDSIGLDVIYSSVKNYIKYFESNTTTLHHLLSGLEELIKIGKNGKKNKDGLLIGQSLPWNVDENKTIDNQSMSEKFKSIFINTFSYYLKEGLLTRDALDTICLAVYNSRIKPSEMKSGS